MPFDQVDFVVPVPSLPAPVDPVLEVLVKARGLIEKPENWFQGDWSNFQVCTTVTARCAWGAIRETHPGEETEATRGAKYALNAAANYDGGFIGFNDDPTTTHADVLSLFDRAISARKQEGVASVSASAEGGSHSPNSPAVLASKGA